MLEIEKTKQKMLLYDVSAKNVVILLLKVGIVGRYIYFY